MAVNAGTIVAYLDMDTSKYTNALQLAQSQATAFARDGVGVGEAIDGIGAAATTVGRALTMGVTTPLVGVGAAAVKMGMDFDAQMSRVKAISGATSEEFARVRGEALKMASSSIFSATDTAQALEYMGMAGWKADQMIAGLPGILNLAAASGESLGLVSDIVTDALTAFGLQASDSALFADVLAAASTNSNTNVGLMGDTFRYVAPLAGSLGYSIEDTALAIGLMANAGIKGGQAGTALRGMLTRLSKPTDDVAAAMERYGISLTDAQGGMRPFGEVLDGLRDTFGGLTEAQKVELAATLAGQEGMSGLLAIVNAGEKDYNKLAGAIQSSAGATQSMSDAMRNNLKGDLTMILSGLNIAGVALSDFLTPALRVATGAVIDAVEWFNGLGVGVKNTAFRIGTIAAAIGPALLVGGKLLSAFNPIVPVLGLVGGGLKLMYDHSERVRGATDRLRSQGPAAFDALSAGVSRYSALMEGGASRTLALGMALETALGAERAAKITATTAGIADGLGKVKAAAKGALKGIGAFAGGLIDGRGVAQSFQAGLEAAFGEGATWQSVGGSIADGLKRGVASAKTRLGGVGAQLMDGLGLVKGKMTATAKNAMAWLGDAWRSGSVQSKLGDLAGVGRTLLGKLTGVKDDLWNKAGELLEGLGEALGSGEVQAKLGDLSGVAAGIAQRITSGMGSWKNTAMTLLGGLVTQITDNGFLAAVLDGIGAIGVAVADGIATAGVNMAEAATSLLASLAGALLQPGVLDGLLTNASTIVTGIGNAIIGAAGSIIPAATELMSTLVGKITESGFVGNLFTTASTVVKEIAGKITENAPTIVGCASDLITELVGKLTETDFVKNLFTNAAEVVTQVGTAIADNAGSIVTAAGELATTLLDGLAEVDWMTVGTSLGTACGKLIAAIVDWFSEPGNAQKLWDTGVLIAKGIIMGFVEGIAPGTFYLDPSEIERPDFSAPEGYEPVQPKPLAYADMEGFGSLFGDGELWAAGLNVAIQQAVNGGLVGLDESMATAATLMAAGFGDTIERLSPEMAASVNRALNSIYDANTAQEMVAAFGGLGHQITNELATAVLTGKVDISTAIGALGAGMSEDMILSMDQLTLKEYLKTYFDDTSSEISSLLQNSAADWGKIFGQAIPDGAAVGLENGMMTLRSKTGEVIAMVSAVDAEAAVKAGNQATGEAGMAALKTGIENKREGAETAAQTAVDGIMEPVGAMEATGKTDSEAMMTAVKLAIEEGAPAATAAIETAANSVVGAAKTILSEGNGKTLGSNYLRAIGSGISAMAGTVSSAARAAAQNGVSAVKNAFGAGYGLGADMASSIASGIRGSAGLVSSAMRQVASRAVGAFRNALDMHSPSRVLVADGMLAAQSVGIGVGRGAADAVRSMRRMAHDMADAWPGVDVDVPDQDAGGGWPDALETGGGQGGVTINHYGDMVVRSDEDVTRVAEELYELVKDAKRGG